MGLFRAAIVACGVAGFGASASAITPGLSEDIEIAMRATLVYRVAEDGSAVCGLPTEDDGEWIEAWLGPIEFGLPFAGDADTPRHAEVASGAAVPAPGALVAAAILGMGFGRRRSR